MRVQILRAKTGGVRHLPVLTPRPRATCLRFARSTSIVQNHVEQGAVDLDRAVVLDEPKLAEAVHEEADAGSRGADHVREGFLADFRDHDFRLAFFSELREQQERAPSRFSLELKS